MAKVYNSITELIGNTPLLRLNNFKQENDLKADLIGKVELFNPNQNIKDRTALNIIEEAEKDGTLKPGDIIAEATSGNTGIGVAAVAAAKGYKARIYLPPNAEKERIQTIKGLGAEVLLVTDVPEAREAIEKTHNPLAGVLYILDALDKEEGVFHLNQNKSRANIEAHKNHTAVEIWNDTDGKIDVLIGAVGTGGTMTGCTEYLKEKNPDIKIIAVEPGPNSFPTPTNPKAEGISGIRVFNNVPNPELLPANIHKDLYDEVIPVETVLAKEVCREVGRLEGILVGVSAGAILAAAKDVASRPEYADKTVVALLPDTGLRYLSTGLFD